MSYYNRRREETARDPYYEDPYVSRDAYGKPLSSEPHRDMYGRIIPPEPPRDRYGRIIPPEPPRDRYGRIIPPEPPRDSGRGRYYNPPAKGRGAARASTYEAYDTNHTYTSNYRHRTAPESLQDNQIAKTGFPYFSEGELQQDLPGCHTKMNTAIRATLRKYPNEDPLWYEVDKLDIEFSIRRNNQLLVEKLPPKPLTQATTPGARGDFKEYREDNSIYLKQFGYDDVYVKAFNSLGKDDVEVKSFAGANAVAENLSLGDEFYGVNDLVPLKDPSLEDRTIQSDHEIVLGTYTDESKSDPKPINKVEPSLDAANLAVDFAFVPDNIEELVFQEDEEGDFDRCKVNGVYIDMRTGETREEKAASLGIPLSAFTYLLNMADERTVNDKSPIGINKKFSSSFITEYNRLMDEIRVVRGEPPYVPPAKHSENVNGHDNVKEEILSQMRDAFKEFQKDTVEEIENLARLNKTLTERLDKAVSIITDMKEAFEEAKKIVNEGHTTDSTISEDTNFTVVDDKITVNDYQRRRYTMIKALPQAEDSTTLVTTKSKEPKIEDLNQLIKVMVEDYETLSLDFREYLDEAVIPLRKEKGLKEFLDTMSDDDADELKLTLSGILTIENESNDKLFCTIYRRNVLMVTQDKSLVSQVYEMNQGEINDLTNPIAKYIKATVSEKGEQLMNYGPIVLYVGQHKCIINLSMTGSTIVRAK